MKSEDFQVGDRVRLTRNLRSYLRGALGTVIGVGPYVADVGLYIDVRFDE
jgi:hypothetical protein